MFITAVTGSPACLKFTYETELAEATDQRIHIHELATFYATFRLFCRPVTSVCECVYKPSASERVIDVRVAVTRVPAWSQSSNR